MTTPRRRRRSVIERFLAKIDPATPRLADGSFDPSVCWLWSATLKRRRSGPVGAFKYQGKKQPAPRISLAIHTGELREDDQACHRRICPTGGLCVNWHHLYWGSQQDNIDDHVEQYGKWGMNKRYGQRTDFTETAEPASNQLAGHDGGAGDTPGEFRRRARAGGGPAGADDRTGGAGADDPVPF
jgi:hypothetical protein